MNSKNLKNEITNLLNEKGFKHNADEALIDELIFNYELIKQAKQEIKKSGMSQQVRKDSDYPLMMVTPQISVYNNSLKNILAISRQLALTPTERSKIKSMIENDNDGF